MNLKAEIIKSLKLQQEQFGDELYTGLHVPKFEKKEHPAPEKIFSPPVQPAKPATQPKLTGPHYPTPEIVAASATIDDLRKNICNCMKCSLGSTRKNFVFGEGNPNARVLVIGEGPGADEDLQGKPFVGRAGQLLTDILKAIKFSRDEVFIANIVKCRPPANRTPYDSEIHECRPYLVRQIEIIKPSFILCLGSTAVQALLERKGTLGSFRKKVFDIYGAQMMVTFHPAALLRNPGWKRDTWEDVQAFRKLYDDKFPS